MPEHTSHASQSEAAARAVFARNALRLRVFLIEDSVLLRNALAEMLGELDNVALVGSAETEAASLAGLEETPSDLVIVDLALREGTGLGVLAALANDPDRYHAPTAVVLSNHAYPQMRERCARLGAAAFFDKSLEIPHLIEFIRERCGE